MLILDSIELCFALIGFGFALAMKSWIAAGWALALVISQIRLIVDGIFHSSNGDK